MMQFSTTPNAEFNEEIQGALRFECEKLTGKSEDYKSHTIYLLEGDLINAGVIVEVHGAILWIDSIYVVESRRRQGLAKELIRQVMEYARAVGARELQLNTFFPDAFQIFVKLEFEVVAVIPNWKYGLTCHMMRRSI